MHEWQLWLNSTPYFHYIIDSWVHLALVAKLYPVFHYVIDSWVHPACGNHVETNLSVGIPYTYHKSSLRIGYLRGFLFFFIQAKARDIWTFFFFCPFGSLGEFLF